MSSDSNLSPPEQHCNGVKGSEIVPYSGNSAAAEELKNHRRRNSLDMLSKQAVIPPQVTTKVKGLFKGLKCISQIFEPNEKEPEMQIGFPTDVKHVAHIGWDGLSVNQPTWMNGFQQAPELASVPPSTSGESKGQHSPTKKTSEGSRRGSRGTHDSQNRDLPEVPKPSRRHHNHDSLNDEQPDASKTSRRRQSGEESDAPKQPRRHTRRSSSSGLGSPTKDRDTSSSSKHTHKKKSSKSIDGGSSRSSRSKAVASAYSDLNVKDSEEQLPTSKAKDEEI